MNPTDLGGLRATLANPSTLEGVHLRVDVRGFRRPRKAVAMIRTIPVRTHRNGKVTIIVESGTYRFQIRDSGVAHIEVQSPEVTQVEVLGNATVTIAADAYVNVVAHQGAVSIVAAASGSGAIRYRAAATVSLTGEGAHRFTRTRLQTALAADRILSIGPDLSAALIAAGVRDAQNWGWP
ncbi:hypothetical protein [Gordonia alkanivorans]|uniref:hypothetical protein n=1 Tax=Gordonia alkanivorans TaxID=84096 RepID=UPI0018CC4806|nr:hypothetical protein [Gordonia alkanivorans]